MICELVFDRMMKYELVQCIMSTKTAPFVSMIAFMSSESAFCARTTQSLLEDNNLLVDRVKGILKVSASSDSADVNANEHCLL